MDGAFWLQSALIQSVFLHIFRKDTRHTESYQRKLGDSVTIILFEMDMKLNSQHLAGTFRGM